VTSWKGDLLGVFPVVAASTTLLGDINAGTSTAEKSANLTLAEVIDLLSPTNTLVADVQSALSAVTAAKGKFAKLLLAPVIKIDLELEKAGMFPQGFLTSLVGDVLTRAKLRINSLQRW
jgi:hypothetical protein